ERGPAKIERGPAKIERGPAKIARGPTKVARGPAKVARAHRKSREPIESRARPIKSRARHYRNRAWLAKSCETFTSHDLSLESSDAKSNLLLPHHVQCVLMPYLLASVLQILDHPMHPL